MQPSQNDTPPRTVAVPQRENSGSVLAPDRDAAAQLMRQQIDTIYDEPHTPVAGQPNTYDRTHNSTTDHQASQHSQHADWKQYHSAWQSYYQQYYERYYLAQLNRRQQAITPSEPSSTAQNTDTSKVDERTDKSPELTRDKAVDELRTKLLTEVKDRSHKVRRSRHFMPLMAALSVAVLFGILQYNQLVVGQVKAYVSPGSINPQNVILDPTASTKVGPEPKIIIPKINVDAPVVYDVPSLEENLIQSKLKDGVVHYPIPGANSIPGQTGNTVILGHSSNDVFDDGDYKFVFVQLEKLVKGDTFYLNHEGTRYTYSVTKTKVIDPTEVGQLVIDSDTPLATLVTCTPPGTALKRLVVIGEQISPDPSKASENLEAGVSVKPANIAGDSPTFFERLFGSN